MLALVKDAVESGEYASSSEVVRDALRDWSQKREMYQQGIEDLRQIWQEAIQGKTLGLSAEVVLERLEQKYKALTRTKQGESP